MKEKNQVGLMGMLAIFSVFLLQGGIGNLNPAINAIAEGLGMDPVIVTQVASFPSFFAIIISFIAGRYVGKKIKYKTLLISVILIFGIGGSLPILIQTWPVIMFSRACVGIAVGTFFTLAPALVLKLYEGAKQGNIMGVGNSVATLGGVVVQILSGFLVDISWVLAFAVHLIGIVSLLLVVIFLPEPEEIQQSENKEKIKVKLPFNVYLNSTITLLFMMLTIPIIISLSIIMADRGIGSGLESGTAMSMFTIGGTVLSLLFGPMYNFFKRFTVVIILLVSAIGMIMVYLASSLIMIFVGMFIIGIGLLITPALMMDNNKIIDPSKIAVASSVVIIFTNVGNFLASYFLILVNKLGANLTMPYPGVFITIILMVAMSVIWFIVRLKQGEPEFQE
ncbi:MAG: MFS transporter [Eubacteriales bacterium]